MDLPLDIKYKIASFDIDTWIRLSYIDEEFKRFSYNEGRKLFIELFTIVSRNSYETTWRVFNKYHRENDKPAIIYKLGTKHWYINGKLHRDNNQPAIIHTNGNQYWYQNGKYHRENDQSAIIYSNGYQCWYQYGNYVKDNK